jgi:hypothetical protein
MAFVILRTEAAERWAGKHAEFSSALKAHARKHLPGFATPQWVVVVEELPVRPAFDTHPSAFSKCDHHTRKRIPEKSRRRSCANGLLPQSCKYMLCGI